MRESAIVIASKLNRTNGFLWHTSWFAAGATSANTNNHPVAADKLDVGHLHVCCFCLSSLNLLCFQAVLFFRLLTNIFCAVYFSSSFADLPQLFRQMFAFTSLLLVLLSGTARVIGSALRARISFTLHASVTRAVIIHS